MARTRNSDGLLPSHGAGSNHQVILRPCIIDPDGRRYRLWETLLVILVIYTAWVSPFEFGFLKKPEAPLSIIDNVVNGFFAMDIVLTFFVAYLDNATHILVDSHKKIARKYASSWLALDVISTIPSELAQKIPTSIIQFYGLFTMLRLWRLPRAYQMFSRLEKDQNYNYFWVRCAKLVCVALFAVHCEGCFYYMLAARYHDPKRTWIGATMDDFLKQSLWSRYRISMYWSVTTLTSASSGDFHPMNSQERDFNFFKVLFNVGLAAYLTSSLTTLFVDRTSQTRKFRDTVRAASSFGQRNQLPARLQDQMLEHLSLKFRTDSEGLQQQEILDSLPKATRSSINHYLFYSRVDKVYLFRGVSKDLLFQLVSELKPEYFPPNEDVILQNEAPTDLYIIATGSVELIVMKNGVEKVVGEANSGDLCGEIGVLGYRPQLFTVRTKRLSQLLRLSRTTFLNIVQARDGTIIINNLLQRLKELNDPIMEGVLVEIENMLARGRMDLPLSLCFAALKAYDFLLHQLLKRGLDPNESDNNGRTALHIAASNGSENCVRLLLDFGAGPNIRDSEANVPLWEAILGRHESVAKLLATKGASLNFGDMGHFAYTAAEQNNLSILKDIVQYGGDVTLPETNMGTTALHVAVSENNVEMVKFLLDHGSDIDKLAKHGLTPRKLADQLDREEIKAIFASWEPKAQSVIAMPEKQSTKIRYLWRFTSEPTMPLSQPDGSFLGTDGLWARQNEPRRGQTSNFHNSLSGNMSAANEEKNKEDLMFGVNKVKCTRNGDYYSGGEGGGCLAARVTITCPEKGEVGGRLVLLPGSFKELLEMGANEFGLGDENIKVLSKDGAQIDDIKVVRDGDLLIFGSADGIT